MPLKGMLSGMPYVMLPIMATIATGYLLECRRSMDVSVLAAVAIYILLPVLTFERLLSTPLTLDEARPLVIVSLLLFLLLWLMGKAIGFFLAHDRQQESFFMLTTLFMNAGNIGMPVALYAFGERGLDLAVVWVLVFNLLTSIFAVYYACRHAAGPLQAIRTTFSVPIVYAAAAALTMRGLHLQLPTSLQEPLALMGRSVIPVAQLLLGMQLAKVRSQVQAHLRQVLVPTVVRLAVSPAIALGLVALVGIDGLTAKIAILLAAMPTAVNMAIYATEFDAQPRLVATEVFISTLASFATVSGLLLWLR